MSKKAKKTVKHRPGTIERRNLKNSVRKSPEWAALRKLKMEEQNHLDPITERPLAKYAECHHLSQDWESYGNLEQSRFVILNNKTHTTVHFIYDLYKRLGSWDFLYRIMDICERMSYLTKEDTKYKEENKE